MLKSSTISYYLMFRPEDYKMTDVVMEPEEEVQNKENIQIKEEEMNNGEICNLVSHIKSNLLFSRHQRGSHKVHFHSTIPSRGRSDQFY